MKKDPLLELRDESLAQEVFGLACIDSFALRSALLKATISAASYTPFYREFWKRVDLAGVDYNSLHTLPLVTRSMIHAAGDRARARAGVVCNEVFTMGTTGPPLVTLRGDKEQAFIRDYFSLAKNQRPGRMARGLKFIDPYHGYHVRVPVPIHFHSVSIYDSGSFEYARETLTKEHLEDGIEKYCTILLGGGRCLRAFTLDTAERFGCVASSLERIVTVGEYLTERWRYLLENTWRATIVDRYSLSEIFGGATQSLACGWWHFDQYVIPEVVDLRAQNNITEGIGALVLTALFPFQQVQPLVRYLTGDLAEVTLSRSSVPGSLAIKPLGRLSQAVVSKDRDTCLITPASMLEVLDKVPEVARSPLLRDSRQVRDNFSIGLPRFAVDTYDDERGRFVVRLRVAINPSNGTDKERRRVLKEISSLIVEKNQGLKRASERGEVLFHAISDNEVSGCDISAPG